jgi:hypothetical protein
VSELNIILFRFDRHMAIGCELLANVLICTVCSIGGKMHAPLDKKAAINIRARLAEGGSLQRVSTPRPLWNGSMTGHGHLPGHRFGHFLSIYCFIFILFGV